MKFLLILAAFVSSAAFAQTQVTVDWAYVAPTQYTDGSAIPSTVMITYNLYVGINGAGSEAMIAVQTGVRYMTAVTSGYTVGDQICGTVTAVVNGAEGPHSLEGCTTITSGTNSVEIPAAPTNLTAKQASGP